LTRFSGDVVDAEGCLRLELDEVVVLGVDMVRLGWDWRNLLFLRAQL
jgi:hypothetical protein